MTERLFVLSGADTSNIRTETLNGREYTVVPIVALVEGVLQGATSPTPELALSSEFGKVPQSWNGRPLVMNHPQDNGQPVPAGDLNAWRGYHIGFVFNSKIEDSKLLVEAWIDNARVEELGGDAVETLSRINNGDNIEVSTGLFADTVQTHGVYNNAQYQGVWKNVIPDHLALLSNGTIGACSNEDGCGLALNEAPELTGAYRNFFIPLSHVEASEGHLKFNCGGNPDCQCNKTEPAPINLSADSVKTLNKQHEVLDKFLNNSIPAGMEFKNVRTILEPALNEALGGDLFWIDSINTEYVTYERWSSSKSWRQSYTINQDNSVSFGDDEVEVIMLIDIVPKPTNGVITMTETVETTEEVVTEETVEEVAEETTTTAAPTTPNVNKQVTLAEYIDNAPPEMREVLQSSLNLHNSKREKLITEIKANKANKFTDEKLKAMNMETLENLHSIAAQPSGGDYSGGAPTRNNQEAPEVFTPAPGIEAFSSKKTAA